MERSIDILDLKTKQRPDDKKFVGKPNERRDANKRVRTRPWDNCWFSNKPHIIALTIEEAIKRYPSYLVWCYTNLPAIKWSTHTIKLFEAIKNDTVTNRLITNQLDKACYESLLDNC